MIELSQYVIDAITVHAERDYPHECGGMLVGRFDGSKKSVVETLPVENAREEEARYNRVLILPADVLKAERYARERKFDLVGYYHSHPDEGAVPSQFDLDHALPVWSYVIASVIKGTVVDIRSWEMEHDRSIFNEEEIERKELSTDAHG